jgi:SM-20-related protein
MAVIDYAALNACSVAHDPFDHVLVPGLVTAEALKAAHEDFPRIVRPGSFPVSQLDFGPGFAALLAALEGPEFAGALGEKLSMSLADKPTMVTVRGRARPTDGKIHLDSTGKLVTVLLYMNPSWEEPGGQLRLLRSPDDLDDYAVEVPPDEGTLLAFPCVPTAWHGHHPFDGERRTIQLNWVNSRRYKLREQVRHTISALTKRATGRRGPGA